MKFTKDTVQNRLKDLSASADLSVARSFLTSPFTVQVDPLIVGKLADERIVFPRDIIRTWDARCENARRKGFKLAGCADFVRKLKSIDNQAELINVVFKNNEGTGLFWFDRKSDELIGFVIADQAEVHKG